MLVSGNWARWRCVLVASVAFGCGGRVETNPAGAAGRGTTMPATAGATACGAVGNCPNGGCCVRGFCLAEGDRCENVGPCVAGHCTECGELGGVCCPGSSNANCGGIPYDCDACNDGDNVCGLSMTCEPCGHDGQQCCDRGCWDTPSVCLSLDTTDPYATSCTTQCGHAGEPCCDNVHCSDGSCCLGEDPGTCVAAPTCGCSAGTCTSCGAEGLSCCDGGACEFGLSCSSVDATGTCMKPRKR